MTRRKALITGSAAVALLLLLFWWGGDSPDLRGWPASPSPSLAAPGTATPSPAPTEPALPSEPPSPAPPSGADSGQDGQDALGQTTPAPSPTPPAQDEPPPSPGGQASSSPDADAVFTCTLTIRCDTILTNLDWLSSEKHELVPDDGVLLAKVSATFHEGETVFDVLRREAKRAGLHMESTSTPGYQSAYIEGIGNLYAMDCGERSGWLYKVNSVFPGYGSSRYALQDGDEITFVYTCNGGEDVGAGLSTQDQRD